MVEAELLRLAERGIREYPPERFRHLAESCHEAGTSTPRLLVLGETIGLLAAAWEPHEALWTVTVDRLDDVLAADLRLVLYEPDEAAAISLASSLREAVALVLAEGPPM